MFGKMPNTVFKARKLKVAIGSIVQVYVTSLLRWNTWMPERYFDKWLT